MGRRQTRLTPKLRAQIEWQEAGERTSTPNTAGVDLATAVRCLGSWVDGGHPWPYAVTDLVRTVLAALPSEVRPVGSFAGEAQSQSVWREIATAPLDGTPVLVRLKNPIPNTRGDLRNWDGITFVGRYHGDLTGWSFAAPVGQGGFPSGWMDGWAPIPAESPALSSEVQPVGSERREDEPCEMCGGSGQLYSGSDQAISCDFCQAESVAQGLERSDEGKEGEGRA